MAAIGLTTQGNRISTAMVLTYSSKSITDTASERCHPDTQNESLNWSGWKKTNVLQLQNVQDALLFIDENCQDRVLFERRDVLQKVKYRQCLLLVDNKIVDHSDVIGASSVGAAPTTSSFST